MRWVNGHDGFGDHSLRTKDSLRKRARRSISGGGGDVRVSRASRPRSKRGRKPNDPSESARRARSGGLVRGAHPSTETPAPKGRNKMELRNTMNARREDIESVVLTFDHNDAEAPTIERNGHPHRVTRVEFNVRHAGGERSESVVLYVVRIYKGTGKGAGNGLVIAGHDDDARAILRHYGVIE